MIAHILGHMKLASKNNSTQMGTHIYNKSTRPFSTPKLTYISFELSLNYWFRELDGVV